MLISDQLIFIHIPKTGGNSIRNLLLKNIKGQKYNPTHFTYDQAVQAIPEISLKKSFCIVRNPFDRFVSLYRFICRNHRLRKWFGENFLQIKEDINTMEKFIDNFVMPDQAFSGHNHFTQQITWANNVQHIFKLEEPSSIMKFLSEFGINDQLPHLNSREIPSYEDNLYRSYYNQRTKNIIQEKFKDDLQKFKYEF